MALRSGRRTAKASGFAPFSIRETQYESCWRSSLVFCIVLVGCCAWCWWRETRTSSVAISWRMSMTSRAALRLTSWGGAASAGMFSWARMEVRATMSRCCQFCGIVPESAATVQTRENNNRVATSRNGDRNAPRHVSMVAQALRIVQHHRPSRFRMATTPWHYIELDFLIETNKTM
jgi:hypothetical protein